MRIGIHYGTELLEVTLREGSMVGVRRAPPAPALPDPAAAVRAALEEPHGYPALRRALTPDDHVAVVVEEHLPHFVDLLTAVLDHIRQADVAPEAITLLCPAPSSGQPWLESLPDEFQDVHVEVHEPADRRHLSYLATTKHGRRIYLNRTVVDADQVVVLAGRATTRCSATPGRRQHCTRPSATGQRSRRAAAGCRWSGPVRALRRCGGRRRRWPGCWGRRSWCR
jgi:hypothetical protein